MDLNVRPLINDLEKMCHGLDDTKKKVRALEKNVHFVEEIKTKLYEELKTTGKANWDDESKRALLDKLYSMDAFSLHERIYTFNNAKQIAPLLRSLDQFSLEEGNNLRIKQISLQRKEKDTEQYYHELIGIIQKLSQCISTLNR